MPGQVAMGDCSPTAPTDPYVHVLMHTAPRTMVLPRMVAFAAGVSDTVPGAE